MLEGLEITIINKSQILSDNSEFRIDSEYYKAEYLELYKKLIDTPILNELVDMSDLSTNGSFAQVAEIIHDNKPKVIPFIRSGNTGDTFINKSELEFISKEAHERLPKSTTHLHDIMMARKGKIGGASIIMPEDVDFNCNENVIKLNIRDKKNINPFYFTAFFNSKYGLKQVERLSTGNVQPWVSIFQIRKLKLFVPSDNFQNAVEKLIVEAHSQIQRSKKLYQEAESLLLDSISLSNFKYSEDPNNIVTFKNSFLLTGRIDAEFYQKKYEQIEQQIKSNNAFDTLNNLIIKIDTGEYSPKYFNKNDKDELAFYIRSTNIKGGKIDIDEDFYVEKKDFTRIAKEGDIVTARVGTIGIFGEVRKDLEDSVYSDNVLCFRFPKSFIPSVYTLLFNTKYYYELIDRLARGSVQQRLNQETLKDLIVPKIDSARQKEISELIELRFKTKLKSDKLLQIAKSAIEIAIEKNENEAMKLIKETF